MFGKSFIENVFLNVSACVFQDNAYIGPVFNIDTLTACVRA